MIRRFVVCDEVHHLQFSLPSFSPSILFTIIQCNKANYLRAITMPSRFNGILHRYGVRQSLSHEGRHLCPTN